MANLHFSIVNTFLKCPLFSNSERSLFSGQGCYFGFGGVRVANGAKPEAAPDARVFRGFTVRRGDRQARLQG